MSAEYEETKMTDPIYELHGVGRSYGQGDQQVDALAQVDLRVERGEFLVIVGPSGSGKTTMLQLLGGLDRPTSGTLEFEGRDLSNLADGDLTELRLAALGFVFQQFNLIPTLTARQNVEVALAPRRLEAPERRARAAGLLESVGLSPAPATSPPSSPVASSSAWPSPAPWPTSRG